MGQRRKKKLQLDRGIKKINIGNGAQTQQLDKSIKALKPGTLKVLKKFLQSVKRGGKARSLTNFLKGSNFNLSDDDSSDGEDDHARKNIRGVQKRGLTRGMTHKNTKFGIIK